MKFSASKSLAITFATLLATAPAQAEEGLYYGVGLGFGAMESAAAPGAPFVAEASLP